ncbi:MAG TPA: translocation/assembly module TamB domain-containing protein [Paucimonas sp.]|nr:translocation/assembly module TamB domain-containing protein [Paucimonas sp.]
MASSARLLRPLLLAVAATVALLFAAVGWLAGSESGARAALGALSGGPLRIEGVSGRLLGPLRIERFTAETPERRAELDRLELEWDPAALLRGMLHIRRLGVARLTVTNKIERSAEPPRLPDRIGLPLALRIDAVDIGGGAIAWGPLDLVELGAAALSLDFDRTRYLLRLHRFSARASMPGEQPEARAEREIEGKLAGQATLSAVKPYGLRVDLNSDAGAALGERRFASQGRLRAEGSLAELRMDIDLALNGAAIAGHGVLRPFSEQPLGATRLALRSLDLAAFGAELPHTALEAELEAAADGSGSLDLRNAAPGLHDAGKLPLRSLRLRFAQRQGRFVFDDIAALLGTAAQPAGSVRGGGHYADGGLTLALALERVDLRRLDRRVRATRLDGRIALRHAAGKQHVALDLTEPFGKQRLALSAAAVLGDTLLAIEHADLRLGDGRLRAAGRIELAKRQSFDFEGKLQRLRSRDLGQFASLPDFDLSGGFSLRGARAPRLEADLSLRIDDSRLAGRPLSGDGEVRLRGERLLVPRLALAAGDNRLDAQGELADDQARLRFTLAAPRLEQLGKDFGGALQANGTVRGSVTRPRLVLDWNGAHLKWMQWQLDASAGKAELDLDRRQPLLIERAQAEGSLRGMRTATQRLDSLALRLRFAPAADAPLALLADAAGIATPQWRADGLRLTAQGTTGSHLLQAVLAEPADKEGRGQRWALDARGGLRDLGRRPRWQGQLERFDAEGRIAARLAAPAALTLSQERLALERFRLESDAAVIAVERFERDERGVTTRGRLERLRLARILELAAPQAAVSSDLVLAGDWDLSFAHSLDGSVRLHRTGGDVVMRSGSPVALGLTRIEAQAEAKNGMLDLRFNADGRQLGHIEAAAQTELAAAGGRFAIDSGAPLRGRALLDIPSLAWAGPMINATAVTEGRLRGAMSITGTLERPDIDGRIDGSGLRLYLGDSGIDLRQGVLESEFRDDTLVVRRLSFDSGGKLAAHGAIRLAGAKPDAQLTLRAERFTLLNRSDRRLVLSGDSRLAWSAGQANATGSLAIDSGYFDIGREDMPQLSDDVVLVGREQKKAERAAAAVDVAIDLGDRLRLQGRGLDATLAGRLRLTAEPGSQLRAQGTVSIARGTYGAYGRQLAIEQGVLRFSGALNNPALDILAMRRGQEVEAGVAVRGTVLAPRVTLVSEPSVPEAEKLSWLVLGRSLDTTAASDIGALQDAAGALLSQGAASTVQSHIATAFGLDDFKIATSQDNLQQRVITLGKRISSRLYVGYEQGLKSASAGASSVVLLRYTLSERLTVEAEAGTRSALSLLYNIMFD